MHTPNNETPTTAALLLDAIFTPKRDYAAAGKTWRVPAFSVTFAIN